MAKLKLDTPTKLDIYYWMRLTRTFDDRMLAYWKQGKGVGGIFSQRGHEATSVGMAYALAPDDVIAPMHRDLGCYLVRGLTPRRIFANLLGRATGVTAGKDANLHGMGDLSLGLIGFISHLPHSLPPALGAAMSFRYRQEPGVAMTFTGDGGSSAGLFHETMNMASVYAAPLVIVVENNLYAYSTPLEQQMKVFDIAKRAQNYGMPGVIVDGNDVLAVYEVAREAVERARSGGGPTLIETKTMRMLGHAIHDGAEYVPRELLATWVKRDPITLFETELLAEGIADQVELDEIGQRCVVEVEDAISFAEASPWPEPETVFDNVYAP
ncbi:MAG: thiamine pyrophosphate-dependent dehydrogenase E1 component subunit alpha [Chloroflexi bacterium]|nr:thiamine pyrophosphate-dependent dehydrogenase E1 component subunit alpha [Chloroflexota bacterium]